MMKYIISTLCTLFLCLSLNAQQTFSSQNPDYIEKVKVGESALKAENYKDCLQAYETAFKIKQTSYLSIMRAAACAFKANDTEILDAYLGKAFELSWGGAKQVFDHYEEFQFLKGSDFETMVVGRYEKAAIASGVNLDLMKELAVIRKTDQEHRMQMGPISEKYGWESPQMDSLWKIQGYVDSEGFSYKNGISS